MQITINISDQLVARIRRIGSRRNIARLTFVGCLVGSAYAAAAPGDPVPNQFSSGDVISATQMNANFGELASQIAEVQLAADANATGIATLEGSVYVFDKRTDNAPMDDNQESTYISVTLPASGTYRCQYATHIQNDLSSTSPFIATARLGHNQANLSESESSAAVEVHNSLGGADHVALSGFTVVVGAAEGDEVHLEAACVQPAGMAVCTFSTGTLMCSRLTM